MKLGLTTTSRSVPPRIPAQLPDVAPPKGVAALSPDESGPREVLLASDVQRAVEATRASEEPPQTLIAPESETSLVRRKPKGASTRQTLTTEAQPAPASETHPKSSPGARSKTRRRSTK